MGDEEGLPPPPRPFPPVMSFERTGRFEWRVHVIRYTHLEKGAGGESVHHHVASRSVPRGLNELQAVSFRAALDRSSSHPAWFAVAANTQGMTVQ